MAFSEIMEKKFNHKESRHICSAEKPNGYLFFSLEDYRNNYFCSDDPNKIIEFYNGFENRDQLIQWMRERPKGVANIHEVEGDKEIIVVIPTADFNGKYAKECRENLFNGLQMIFVESGEVPDPYFNIAHNLNVGIKKAMEYNPKWVVFSGDDMIKVDPISKLISELRKMNNRDTDVVFTAPSQYHSTQMFLGKPNHFFSLSIGILRFFLKRFSHIQKTYYQLRRFNKQLFFPRYEHGPTLPYKIVNFIFFKRIEPFVNILSFGIFSSNLIRKSNESLFDENYINEMEDTDLSIRIKHAMYNTSVVDFKINEYIGSSFGNGGTRTLRVLPGWTYFSYKIENRDFDK
jgi:hypothetical protein